MTSPSAAPAIVTAAFVIIGDEILSGRTRDANLAYLAEQLVEAGIRLEEVRVVTDRTDAIVRAVNELRGRLDHVFTSGGIGPTHDDITCDAVAEAFGVAVERHPEAVRRMREHAARRGLELNEARMRMARTPSGAVLIRNPVSAAPGFTVGNVHVMAGVPSVFQAMVQELLPSLRGGDRLHSLSVVCDLGEGVVAGGLGGIQERYPDVGIGSYPYYRAGAFGTTLVMRGTGRDRIELAAGEVRALVRSLGGTPIDVTEET